MVMVGVHPGNMLGTTFLLQLPHALILLAGEQACAIRIDVDGLLEILYLYEDIRITRESTTFP